MLGCWGLSLSFLPDSVGAARTAEVPKELDIPLRGGEEVSSTVEEACSLAPQPGLQVWRKPEPGAAGPSAPPSCPTRARWPQAPTCCSRSPKDFGIKNERWGGPWESWNVGLGQGRRRGHLDSRMSSQRILEPPPWPQEGPDTAELGVTGIHSAQSKAACGSDRKGLWVETVLCSGWGLLFAESQALGSEKPVLPPGAAGPGKPLWGARANLQRTRGCAPHWPGSERERKAKVARIC